MKHADSTYWQAGRYTNNSVVIVEGRTSLVTSYPSAGRMANLGDASCSPADR